MSQKTLIPIGLLCASAAFSGVRWLAPAKEPSPGPGAFQTGMPEGCESCKNTPSNRFGLMAGAASSSASSYNTLHPKLEAKKSSASSYSEARLFMMESLSGLSTDELVAYVETALNATSFASKLESDYLFAVKRLVEVDPRRAADLWAGHSTARMSGDLFLGEWVKKDPQAFADWNAAQTASVQNASRLAIGQWAGRSPEQLAGVASQLSQSEGAPEGARRAVAGMLEKDKSAVDAAYEYAQALPAGAMRNAALLELLKNAGSAALTRQGMAEALSGLDREEAGRIARNLASIAADLPAGAARQSAFAHALGEQAKGDAAAAAQRLDGLAGSSDYPAAVRGFVEATAAKDPAAAAEWALSISSVESVQRCAALEKVASAWFKANPEAARAWVEGAALSDTEYFQLTGRTRAR